MCKSQDHNSDSTGVSSAEFDYSFWRDKSLIQGSQAYIAKQLILDPAIFHQETLSSMVKSGETRSIRQIKKCLISWTCQVIEEEYKMADGEIIQICMWKDRLDAMFEFCNFLDCAVVASIRKTDFLALTCSIYSHGNSDTIDYVKDFIRNGFLLLCNDFNNRCDPFPFYEHSFNFQVLNSFLEMLLGNFQDQEAHNAQVSFSSPSK